MNFMGLLGLVMMTRNNQYRSLPYCLFASPLALLIQFGVVLGFLSWGVFTLTGSHVIETAFFGIVSYSVLTAWDFYQNTQKKKAHDQEIDDIKKRQEDLAAKIYRAAHADDLGQSGDPRS